MATSHWRALETELAFTRGAEHGRHRIQLSRGTCCGVVAMYSNGGYEVRPIIAPRLTQTPAPIWDLLVKGRDKAVHLDGKAHLAPPSLLYHRFRAHVGLVWLFQALLFAVS